MPLSPDRLKVVELYKKGLRGRLLAEATNYSAPGVYHILDAARVKKDPPGRRPISRERIIQTLWRAQERGLSTTEAVSYVARTLGCGESTIYRARREFSNDPYGSCAEE